MSQFHIISLILLVIVLIDAAGDAMRLRKRQILHHSLEVAAIIGFFAVWSLDGFMWEYILMYVFGRIALFDMAFNIFAGNKLTYVGKSSIYDMVLGWFSELIREPGQLVWVLKGDGCSSMDRIILEVWLRKRKK